MVAWVLAHPCSGFFSAWQDFSGLFREEIEKISHALQACSEDRALSDPQSAMQVLETQAW